MQRDADRTQRILFHRLSFRAAEMGHQNRLGAVFAQVIDRRQALTHPGVVGDDNFAVALFGRNVEINPDQDAFSPDVEVRARITCSFPGCLPLNLSRDQLQHLHAAIAVAPLVVVPADDFHELPAVNHRQLAVEDAGVRVAHDVAAKRAARRCIPARLCSSRRRPLSERRR